MRWAGRRGSSRYVLTSDDHCVAADLAQGKGGQELCECVMHYHHRASIGATFGRNQHRYDRQAWNRSRNHLGRTIR